MFDTQISIAEEFVPMNMVNLDPKIMPPMIMSQPNITKSDTIESNITTLSQSIDVNEYVNTVGLNG